MVRALSAGNQAAISAGTVIARDFLWIKARTLITAVPYSHGFWSGVGDVSAFVLDPETGLPQLRNFEGSGTLISVSDIPLVSNLTIQNVTITLSQLDPASEAIVRGYDLRQAGVEVYRGLYDVTTRQLAAPAFCRFVGFVDEAPIETPEEGGVGSITLNCTSHLQEITRSNPDTRSDDSQRKRSATDNFFQDVAVVGDWEQFWGKKSGKVATQSSVPVNYK